MQWHMYGHALTALSCRRADHTSTNVRRIVATLIVSLTGPFGANRHDSFVLTESGIVQRLIPSMRQHDERFYLYGDMAYCAHHDIMSPYAVINNADEQQLNTLHSRVRIMVEHGFAKVLQYFAFTDFHKTQRMHLSPTAAQYRLSVLFANIHSCIYGNLTCARYNTMPPTVEQYLGAIQD